MEESTVACAGDAVEVSVGGAGRDWGVDRDADSIVELEATVANAGHTVVEGVGWAGGDGHTLSTDELSTSHTDTSL